MTIIHFCEIITIENGVFCVFGYGTYVEFNNGNEYAIINGVKFKFNYSNGNLEMIKI